MKNLYILGILITLFSQNSLAQADSVAWVYKHLGNTYSYSKLGDTLINGDTLSVYSNNVFLKEGGDTTFYYKNGQLNFLYANNAQVGDIWHPLYTTWPCEDTTYLTLKVKTIDSVLVAGQWLNRFRLSYVYDVNNEYNLPIVVIEKIGVFNTDGFTFGMLYEFLPIACDGGLIMDFPGPCLLSYYSEELNYSYTRPIQNTCYNGLSEEATMLPKIIRNGSCVEVKLDDSPVSLKLYDVSGQIIQEVRGNKLILPSHSGLYFLHIQQKDGQFKVVKLMN